MDDFTDRSQEQDEGWKRQALAHGWIPPEAQSIWLENQRLKWEQEQDQSWDEQPRQQPRRGHGCLWAFLIAVVILVMVWRVSASVAERGAEIDRHTTRPTTSTTK